MFPTLSPAKGLASLIQLIWCIRLPIDAPFACQQELENVEIKRMWISFRKRKRITSSHCKNW